MIEMRWLERMERHKDGYQIGPFKVLQYREGEYSAMQWSEKKGDYEYNGPYWYGTAWKDVPEERG